MRDDAALLRWLLHVEEDGICVIENAPLEQGVTRRICDRVAYPKLNHYGYESSQFYRHSVCGLYLCFCSSQEHEDLTYPKMKICSITCEIPHGRQVFVVKNKVEPNNLAYTTAALGLHTDLPQVNYTPGVSKML